MKTKTKKRDTFWTDIAVGAIIGAMLAIVVGIYAVAVVERL